VAHFVYTLGPGQDASVLGASMAIDREDADRIAVYLADTHGEEVTVQEVQEITPQPVQVGDVVSGKTAMTLPKGSAIVRVSTADGVKVRVSGALLRCPSGYCSGHTDNDTPGGIDERSRYRVLHLGAPWDPGQRCRS